MPNTLTNSKLRRLAEIIAREYGVTVEDILSKARRKPVAEARHVLAFLGDQMFKLGSSEIGRQLGRDHATILNSFEYVLHHRLTDLDLIRRIERIQNHYETEPEPIPLEVFQIANGYGFEAAKVLEVMSRVFEKISKTTKELADELDRTLKNLKSEEK